MRIVIDPEIYNLRNMGGVAMFQVLARRLQALWPEAELHAFTDDVALLKRYCPGVQPLPHATLTQHLADRFLLGSLHRYLPGALSRGLVAIKARIAQSHPLLLGRITLLRMKLARQDRAEYTAFLKAVSTADLIVISGGSGFNDSFPAGTRLRCTLLEIAGRRGVPAAIFSQSVGPMKHPVLRARAARALSHASLIALRERAISIPLLESLQIPSERIRVTGDDAIELACSDDDVPLRQGIGVNLRLAHYTAVGDEVVEAMKSVIHDFARARGAPLLPMPIALHDASPDQEAIRMLLAGYDDESDGGAALDTPELLIEQAGRCRVVVTGAYHAAVFALSQGVPVVAVAQTDLYFQKFGGLADQFGGGCEVVSPSEDDFPCRLAQAIDRAWEAAPALRSVLRSAAARQRELGSEAYQDLRRLVDARMVS